MRLAVFLVVIAVRDFGDASNVGWLQGSMGVGTIVGGVMILSRVAEGELAQDMVVGVLGWSVPIIAWPSSRRPSRRSPRSW